MVLINNLTIDEINAALLHLQRARTEVVGGIKGSTVQNITISNKGGGSTVDYAPTITALSNRIDKNTDDIESVEGEIDKIHATLEQLSDNGISSMTFDPISRQLQINTQDGEVYSCDITSENITLDFDATTNKLTLEMGEQYQEVTLPYINANEKGSANGVATLDSSGRVPYSQLPESAMEFLGQWNASTNTPHLEDGTGTNGDFYVCNVGGTVTFGTGNTQTFVPNDRVIYNGATSQWIKLPAGQVSSVNGMSGDVTLTASNIEYSTGVSIKAKIDANAVQADWNVTDTTSLAYIKNKPTIPASPVQSDWNVTDTTSLAYIKNKPTIPSTPTLVCCAKCVFLDAFDANADRPVMVACPRGTTGYSSQGVSICCCFTFNPALGVLRVQCLCGTASYAKCAEEASFANCVCKTKYSTSCNCDLNVMMVSSVPGSSNDFAQGYAQGCCLTYNPSTGQLRLKSNGKTACISHINTSFLHIYTDAPGIAFNQYLLMAGANNYVCGNLCGVAAQAIRLNATHTNEFNFCVGGNSPRVWFNYRNGSTDAADSTHLITDYIFGNRNLTTSGVTLHADYFCGVASCALRANCAVIETYEGTYCCGWTWIGSCMNIWELFPQFFHVSLRGSTCQGNLFQGLCAFICSRALTEKSGDSYHYIHGSGAVRLNNGCHASLCAISYFKCNLGGDISWIAVCGTESYFVFYRDCVCSSCICCLDFYFGS